MGKLKKKGASGEANRFMSRNKAIRKLQLNLCSFNRLCIIKGLFPIEPKNRIKAQKGDSKYRPLFLKKDIKFLMHDPLIWTIREEMALYKKMRKANHKNDVSKVKVIKRNKPIYRLDQNVLERYPSFIDAVKDLADPLTMVFLFASIQACRPVREHHISRCQRLKTEFMTYVIESRSLTKAFISTRGYYYEAEIIGRRVVWTVPHNCVTDVPPNADMKIMVHFLEFNIAMLGFVNFRLLSKVNLRYPLKPAHIPRLTGSEKKDLDNFKNLMVSLNYPMERTQEKQQSDAEADNIDSHLIEGSTSRTKQAFSESLQCVERRKLFAGLKFFISQENNRESLTLVIRSCGGEVSWPSTMFPCSTYVVDDQCVTHQIVDRPDVQKKHLSRYYIQPQWVYDSLNTVTLQPCQSYFPDAALPPHVCPFLKNYEGWYIPPEEETMRKLLEATPEEKQEILNNMLQEEQQRQSMMRAVDTEHLSDDDDDDDNGYEDSDDELNTSGKESDENMSVDEENKDTREENNDTEEENNDEGNNAKEDSKEDEAKKAPKKPEVRRGRELIIKASEEAEKEAKNEYKMKAFMIHRGNKRLYNKLREKEIRSMRTNNRFKERREAIELHKAGKLTKEEIDYPVKKPIKLTIGEKKKKNYNRRVASAVKFSRSAANKNRDK